MGHSRPQIAKEFRINERTLCWLEQTGRLQLDWTPINGLLTCTLDENATRVLTCASVAMPALDGKGEDGLLPFHRFLVLRTLQMPVEIQYQELVDRNIISEAGFSLETITAIREKIIDRLPLIVKRMVKLGRAPETDEERQWLDGVLDVCEIHLAYHHPELEQSFQFMPNVEYKEAVDCAVSTKSNYADIQKFLLDVLGLKVSVEGIAFYQQLFHDVNIVSSENLKLYLKKIRPSLRNRLTLAVNSSIDTFRVKSGIDDKFEVDKVMSVFKDDLINDLLRMINNKVPESERAFNNTLRSLVLVLDRMDRIKSANTKSGSNVPQFFKTIKVAPQPADNMKIFQLPSAKDNSQAQ